VAENPRCIALVAEDPGCAEAGVAAGALALGRIAAGPLPPEPRAVTPPPPHAPSMPLAPYQRAVFTASAWSVRPLLVAVALTALIMWVGVERYADGHDITLIGFAGWYSMIGLVFPLFIAAPAYTRVQIDGSGVTVRVPMLPVLSRTVPYEGIRFAEVGSESPPGRYRLSDTDSGWGVVTGKGPVLVVSLADSRSFVYSTREAETAARLINGWLNRQRGGAASC
ncbi:hypothetical protein, partial [Streptosporangium lutulentum]